MGAGFGVSMCCSTLRPTICIIVSHSEGTVLSLTTRIPCGMFERSAVLEFGLVIGQPADLVYSSPSDAVSGAVCSNDITPRYFSAIDASFPAVAQYEIPAFLADSAYTVPATGTPFIKGTPDDTVYAIWIGTNDLGNYALIQDAQVEGTNLTSYVDCVYASLKRVYDNGGRYFVLFNNAPLYFAPQYAAPPNDVGANQGWPDKPRNHTLIEQRMVQQVTTTVSADINFRL